MKIPDILERLFSGPITPLRVQKAQQLADRSHLLWADVLAAMPPEQRALVDA